MSRAFARRAACGEPRARPPRAPHGARARGRGDHRAARRRQGRGRAPPPPPARLLGPDAAARAVVSGARAPTGRTTRRKPADASTTPQRDEATGESSIGGPPQPEYSDMKLPHEHDESAERDTGSQQAGGPRPEIDQGATDV